MISVCDSSFEARRVLYCTTKTQNAAGDPLRKIKIPYSQPLTVTYKYHEK